MKQFNNQFATQKLRQETSMTGTGATFTPGTGEQTAPKLTKKVVRKKLTPEKKDVEPKLAAGKAKVYMKDKWGWKDAPSIPNRPSKGGFIYKQLFEELSSVVNEANVPDNIASFAKRKGATDIVNTVASWAEKAGKKIVGGTAIGKNYNTLVLDLTHQGSEIYINLENDTMEVNGQRVRSYDDFAAAIKLNINENYSKFKNETKTRNKSDQFHQAIREVRKKVQEINRLFEYVSRLKSELSEGEGGLKYKVHTEKALEKIKEMVAQLNQNVKKFK